MKKILSLVVPLILVCVVAYAWPGAPIGVSGAAGAAGGSGAATSLGGLAAGDFVQIAGTQTVTGPKAFALGNDAGTGDLELMSLKRGFSDPTNSPQAGFGGHVSLSLQGNKDGGMVEAAREGAQWENNQTNLTTQRDSKWIVQTLLDNVFGTKFTVASSGYATPSVGFKTPNGTASAPPYTFTTATGSGMFQTLDGAVGMTVGGNVGAYFTAGPQTILNSTIILGDGTTTSTGTQIGFAGGFQSAGSYQSFAFKVGGSETVRLSSPFANSAQGNTLAVLSSGNLNAICVSSADLECDLAFSSGLFLDNETVGQFNAGTVGPLTLYGDPFRIQGNTYVVDISATLADFNGPARIVGPLEVGTGGGGVPSITTLGAIASKTPFPIFSVGPVAAFTTGLVLGSRKLTQDCTITAGSAKALTAGTAGSAAPTISITDATNTCTLTSGSGCNAAANTDEAWTTSGVCVFPAGQTLNFVGIKGNCTTGPSFYNIVVDCKYQ